MNSRQRALFALCFSIPLIAVSASAAQVDWNLPTTSAVGVSDSTNITNGQSLSALFLSKTNWIQTFLGVNHTSGAFDFAVGGAYEFTIAGNQWTGLHFGPGLSLGSVDQGGQGKFSFAFFGLLGVHTTLMQHLILSVDGGPILSDVDGNANFSIRPMGNVLGLGVHYLF